MTLLWLKNITGHLGSRSLDNVFSHELMRLMQSLLISDIRMTHLFNRGRGPSYVIVTQRL